MHPRLRNAWWILARRSYRTASLRNRWSQANVRSTTHRWMPSFSFDSMPLPAMRGGMSRPRQAFRHRLKSQSLLRMEILRAHPRHQRSAPSIRDQMMFAPSSSPIGRIRPRFRAPLFFAAMLEASSEALDQSSFPDPCNLSGNTRWIRSHSPSPFHRCNRRQHVIPLPQPILRGGCSCQLTRGDPLWNRYRVPFLPEGMRHSPVPRQAPEECPFR